MQVRTYHPNRADTRRLNLRSGRREIAALALATLTLTGTALAAEEHDKDELAKKVSNPVSSMISVPFQFNPDFNIGPEDGTRTVLNIQPVIPMSISEDWNLITRVIVPVITQNDVFGDSGTQSGIGDITPTLFFSPKAPTAGGLIWGVGPVFLLRTASDELLGGEKWGAGPSVVLLEQTGDHWTYGMLANHIWSFAGDDDRADISSTFLQPFLSKGIGNGRTLGISSEATYNWEGPGGERWKVPINAYYSQVVKIGSQMVNLRGGVRGYATTPFDNGPDWGLRFEANFLFPR